MTPTVLIAIKEVCRRTGICRAKVYQLMKAGTFPQATHIGTASRWSELEVQAWVEAQLAKRGTAA